jgi:hypothetical protein
MSRFQSRRWRSALVLALILPVLLPFAIRDRAFIEAAAPIWLLMLAQALAVIAAAILVAWVGATLVVWWRGAGRADA